MRPTAVYLIVHGMCVKKYAVRVKKGREQSVKCSICTDTELLFKKQITAFITGTEESKKLKKKKKT